GGLGDGRGDGDPRLAERDRERAYRVLVGLEPDLAVGGAHLLDSGLPEADGAGAVGIRRAQAIAARGAGQQLPQRALVDDAPLLDDGDAVAELLDLAEQVAGEQDGDPLA